jgi:hypothetical protein
VVSQVAGGPIDVLCLEGTPRAGGTPLGRKHQVMDDQLTIALEQLMQPSSPALGVE